MGGLSWSCSEAHAGVCSRVSTAGASRRLLTGCSGEQQGTEHQVEGTEVPARQIQGGQVESDSKSLGRGLELNPVGTGEPPGTLQGSDKDLDFR